MAGKQSFKRNGEIWRAISQPKKITADLLARKKGVYLFNKINPHIAQKPLVKKPLLLIGDQLFNNVIIRLYRSNWFFFPYKIVEM